MRMKLIPTCCSDCNLKPPSTAVTFRSLTCMLRGMKSKFWICLGARWRSSCSSLWQTCAWPGVSTLDFKSTRTRVTTDFFAGQSNGSVSFQLAQLKVGEDKVPVFIVLYIDGTCLKKGILIRPVYHKCMYISYPISCVILYPISYLI